MGEPTLAQVMRRPRWILALLLALVVAGVFAWLGRWQMQHAVTVDTDNSELSEVPRVITDVTGPGEPVTDQSAGMVLTFDGTFVDGDFLVVDQRTNHGEVGAWVTGHAVVDDGGGHLPVAIGWAPSVSEAERAIAKLESGGSLSTTQLHVVGRYMPSDAPVVPKADEDLQQITTMVPAQLINLWAPFDGAAYAGFLVTHATPGDGSDPFWAETLSALELDPIESVAPLPVETINWLNLFYAAEWVVFAGFAIFFWFRLVRDDWEKQHEYQLAAQQAE